MSDRPATVAVSRSFPLVAPADLLLFIEEMRRTADVNAVLRKFRAWVRRRVKKKT